MTINYVLVIAEKFPNVICHIVGDPSVYANIVWDGGDPLPSESDLDAATVTYVRERMYAQINDYRDTWALEYFTWNNHKWDCDETSRQNIIGANTLSILNNGNLYPGFTWRDYDNNDVPMTASDMGQLGAQLMKFATVCYQVGWGHKANIEALTDVNSILSYDYTSSLWPDKNTQI